jgi:hypothetical protein
VCVCIVLIFENQFDRDKKNKEKELYKYRNLCAIQTLHCDRGYAVHKFSTP